MPSFFDRDDEIYIASFLRYLLSSSPKEQLQRTRESIQTHFTEFKNGAQLAHRRNMRLQHLETKKKLAATLIIKLDDETSDNPDDVVQFPISTVEMFRNSSMIGRRH